MANALDLQQQMRTSYPTAAPLSGPAPTPTATPVTPPPTGGNTPPVPYTPPVLTPPPTGGNTPPQPYTPPVLTPPPTGGNTPATPYNPTAPTAPYNTGIVPPNMLPGSGMTQNPGNFGPSQTVQQMLDSFIKGKYAQNARQRGMEQANSRGLINSNIAAGTSERAALEAVQPFVSEGMGLLNNREDRALRQQLQSDAVLQQDWLQTRQFNNQFNAQLSMLPVTNSMQMLQALTQYAMQEPEVYTPEIMSGYSAFFNNNMLTLLKQYFPNMVQGG